MNRTKIYRLGDLQLRIMQLLWSTQEATVGDLHERLRDDKDLAYTTVATMLRKMEARGRGMADHLVDRLFEGSLTDVVSHLLSTREVSRAELTELERLIAQRKKAL
jgi:predicted transcriptional regulator